MQHQNIFINSLQKALLILIVSGIVFVSCNKELPIATPIKYPPANPVDQTIGDVISQDSSYSIFLAAAKRVGMLAALKDPSTVFTAFIPDDQAFQYSGIPSAAVINMMPIEQVAAIVQYHLIPGHQFLAADFSTDFPNTQLPSSLTIGTLPGTSIPLKMSIFPSRRGNNFWINRIPISIPDIKCKNGVIHVTTFVVQPPSKLLKDAIYSDPNLSYFKAAIARADSGMTGTSRLDSLLGYGVTNMTVLVPNNAAFQTLIYGTAFSYYRSLGLPALQAQAMALIMSSSPAIFTTPSAYGLMPAATVRGILAYHFLASDIGAGYQPNIRVFSNNFSETPALYHTLINSSVAVHPGVKAQATFFGPFVANLTFTGMGTFPPGGAPFSGPAAHVVSLDNIAVNGVYDVIDRVLLPQ